MRREIEDLYRAYASYPLVPDVEYCDHCVYPDEVAALHAVPLRAAPPELMGTLLMNNSTWGDQELRYYRHFLPRMLELVVAGDLTDHSYPVMLSTPLTRIRLEADPAERAALDAFAEAWWAQTISEPDARCTPGDVFMALTDSGWPVRPLLDAWPAGSPARLADFVLDTRYGVVAPEVRAWLASGTPEILLYEAPGDLPSDDRERIAGALELLTAIRAA